MSRYERLPIPVIPKTEKAPVIPTGNISIVNLEQKKKPFNVNIRNYNPNEPKNKTKYEI